jgi:serine/threonine protein kinase/tetratricopeptide (TPR) repeat protein
MKSGRDQSVMRIVDQAMEMSPAQRQQFLKTACGADTTLLEDVEALLNVDAEARCAFDDGARQMRDVATAQIGPYRLLDVIGEGGMGVVWRAQQREPIRRVVALKLIKLGMDTGAVIARFESERQALAMMNHPNVARVFDAGATDTGRPYFVMEHVAGEPITTFCDRHNYTNRQRLELFVQACDAVQHAHQKAIIHRDIKPSNVLVALQDGKPVVKVIDFGVAKAVSQQLTERTLFTEAGQLVGTPEYMSPEQAEMNALDIDTRTDVYALGVLLYELLTGALPFEASELRRKGFNEIQRIIRESDPPRPSTRVSSLGAPAQAEVAARRGMEPSELAHELRGELEWIPLKALRKDRTQRYATATEFAQDVQNYLAQRPLIAGPESAAYRARKFLKRNRGPVIAAALVALALLGGIAATSVALVGQSRARAEAERRRAESDAVNEFLTDDVLSAARPEHLPDKTVRDAIVSAMIDPAAAAVATRFKDKPLIEAAVRNSLGQTYCVIGRADLGEPHAAAALQIRRRLLGNDHPDTLMAMNNMAYVLEERGKLDEAEPLYREALEGRRRVLGDDHRDTTMSINNLAELLMTRGMLDQAEPLWREAIERQRRTLGNDHPETLTSIENLGALAVQRGNLGEAETLWRESLNGRRRVLGENHPETINSMNNVGYLLKLQGNLDEAEATWRDALARSRRVLGEDHPNTIGTLGNVAGLLLDQGKFDEAEPLHREVLDRATRVLGPEHPNTLMAIENLGRLIQRRGDLAAAEPVLRESLAGRRKILGNDHPDTLSSITNLGLVLLKDCKLAEAESLLRESVEISTRTNGPNDPTTFLAIDNLGYVLQSEQKFDEAEPLLADLFHRSREAKSDPKLAARMSAQYGICLLKMHRYADGEAALRESRQRLLDARATGAPEMASVVQALAQVCDETSRSQEAAAWRAELEKLDATTRPASKPVNQNSPMRE